MNRAVARLPLFQKDDDYEAFEQIVEEALERHPIRILGYCVMPNHWHFVLWPQADGELTAFLRWLTHTHSMRWHTHHQSVGSGHLYQGRFKSFPVESDEHYLTVLRYVERNALRAQLVDRAEDWRWGSLWRRQSGNAQQKLLLSDGPLPLPARWASRVNTPQSDAELEVLRRAVARGTPYGDPTWQARIGSRLGLESTLRARGRPRKVEE